MSELESDHIFLVSLKELLDDGKCDEAICLYEENSAKGSVERSLWELAPMLLLRLGREDKLFRNDVKNTCKILLDRTLNNCSPREIFLIVVGEIPNITDEETFAVALKILSESMNRISPIYSIDWCIQSIKNYIKRLPIPSNEKPEENEPKEEDPIVDRLCSDYKTILCFFEPIVDYIVEEKNYETKNNLLGAYLFLFGAPFCYLDDSSNIKFLYESTLKSILKLTRNFFNFHGIIEDRSLKRKKRISQCEDEILPRDINDLSYANYYYFVLNTEVGRNNTAQIYNPVYLSRGFFYLGNLLLREPKYVLVSRGLFIIESAIEKIESFSLTRDYLEIPIYLDIFSSLAQVMIYCDVDSLRKSALRIFSDYIDSYEYRARYLVILHLCKTSNHSGLLSLIIDIAKKSVIRCLEESNCDYFLGKNLKRFLKIVCHLKNGSATDLIEISDEVITSLNFLRFLTIRDRDNSTGIWSLIETLEKNYLKPLREGIDLSRAHWQMKIKDLEEERKIAKEANDTTNGDNISISVGGKNLEAMPIEEKIKFCHQALNVLDVMESILIRVNECVEEKGPSIVEHRHED